MFKTKDGHEIDVVELTEKEVIDQLEVLLPNFAGVLQRYAADDCKFYKASYQFGTKIIRKGKCYLPLKNGGSVLFNDPSLPQSLAIDLNYDPKTEDPLGVVLSKNSEFYYRPVADKIVSRAIITPGNMFGIPRATEILEVGHSISKSALEWSLNAGARFLFCLSKISAKHRYEKLLKSRSIDIKQVPITAEEHQPIFIEIAKQAQAPWRCEILFFSRKWINKLKQQTWAEVSNYLMHRHRASYNIFHNTSLLWDSALNAIIKQKRLTDLSSYTLAIAKQLLYIAANSAPGLVPATNDDSAPIELLKELYANGYGLEEENQSNIIMVSSSFDSKSSNVVYYSLNNPMLAQYNPDTYKGKSHIALLADVQRAAMALQQGILSKTINNIPDSLYDVAANTEFTFYHSNYEPQNYKHIVSSKLLKEEDPRFTANSCGEFPEHSSFFKGCIKISHKPNTN